MMWEGIAEFCAVASTGSFTAAATKLDTSGAQISRKVANVEKRLGVKLFNRTTRSVSLTQAGHIYFEQC
ncbi:LysR family transcriptional regulator, partial [Alteromonas stellipolaris]